MFSVQILLRSTILSLLLCVVPQFAAAQSSFLDFDVPYVVYQIDTYTDGQWYYSELIDHPEMYGFSLSATTTVHFAIAAVDHTDRAPGFSGILVEDEGQRGVREVGRFLANDASWNVFTDSRTKMEYRTGPRMSTTLGPGEYRVEVSTPNNVGRYVLKLGTATTPQSGYIQALREIRATQDFHGHGWLHMVRTKHVYVPIVLGVIFFGLYGAYRYSRRKKTV